MRISPLRFVTAAIVGAVAVVALTIVIYGTFFQDFLEGFTELSPETLTLITRDHVNIGAFVIANLAHGVLLATVITWSKRIVPVHGAVTAATVAFLTEVYFLFTQYATFRTMDLVSAIADTLMWTAINAVVGALVARILRPHTADRPSSERSPIPPR